MSNHQEIVDLAQSLADNKNLYYLQPFIKITGNAMRGLFLERVVYWSDKSGNDQLKELGMFYKSTEDWEDEIGFSYSQVTSIRKELEVMGFIQTSKHKVGGAPTLHYYANMDAIKEAVVRYYDNYAKLRNSEIQKSSNSENDDFQIQKSQKTIEIQECSTSSYMSTTNSTTKSTGSRQDDDLTGGPICQSLLKVCKLNWNFTKRNRTLFRALKQTLEFLIEEEAQPDDIKEFATWRKDHHWTAKDGSAPTLKQVGELWGQFQDWKERGKPLPISQNGATNAQRKRTPDSSDTPPAGIDPATWARLNRKG